MPPPFPRCKCCVPGIRSLCASLICLLSLLMPSTVWQSLPPGPATSGFYHFPVCLGFSLGNHEVVSHEWLSMVSYHKHSPKLFSFHLRALSSLLNARAFLHMPSSVMTSVHLMLYSPFLLSLGSLPLLLPGHHLTEKTMARACCQSLVFMSGACFLPWGHQKPSV